MNSTDEASDHAPIVHVVLLIQDLPELRQRSLSLVRVGWIL